jgi:membrane associated rhomboid family serine protease
MILPIGDDQVKGGHFPLFSYSFIAFNILFFVLQLQFPDNLVCSLGAIPSEVRTGQDLYAVITSMFMHGGWWHLIGNMAFLWVFADNVEATIGNSRFFLFYLGGGIAAVLAHTYFSDYTDAALCCAPCGDGTPCTGGLPVCGLFTPMVGASGAISALLGAYLVMFPQSRIKLLFLVFPFRLPAFLFLGIWIFQQMTAGFRLPRRHDYLRWHGLVGAYWRLCFWASGWHFLPDPAPDFFRYEGEVV